MDERNASKRRNNASSFRKSPLIVATTQTTTKNITATITATTTLTTPTTKQNLLDNTTRLVTSPKKHRQLIQSTENISIATICCDIPASVVATLAATVNDVMGGGFTTPPPKALFDLSNDHSEDRNKHQQKLHQDHHHNNNNHQQKVNKVAKSSCPARSITSDHKPLCASPSSTAIATGTVTPSESPSLFGTTLCGLGRITAPFFLESPDEPPEFEYHHFSATDSSNSQEGSCDFVCDLISDPTVDDISNLGSYSAIQHDHSTAQSSMGGEVSTTSSGGIGNKQQQQQQKHQHQHQHQQQQRQQQQQQQQQLKTQSSTKSDGGIYSSAATTNLTTTNTSRSCSLSSESSSAKLTRLQNFLFKSSESSKSFQGHSNDGYTASSYASSSGEWESVNTAGPAGGMAVTMPMDSSVEYWMDGVTSTATTTTTTSTTSYYQYTLTSPNNPFLPEITARSYHSNNNEQLQHQPTTNNVYDEFDSSTFTIPYGSIHSPKLSPSTSVSAATFNRVSAGSAETAQQNDPYGFAEGQSSCSTVSNEVPGSSVSSPGGRHKRKLFSLNSPIRGGSGGGDGQQKNQQQGRSSFKNKLLSSPATTTSTKTTALSSTSSPPSMTTTGRSLNPFLSSQEAANSAAHMSQDINAKREEFLRATMKICLVVSPPSSKLQLKSKSLTHLDGLNSMIACNHGTGKARVGSDQSADIGLTSQTKQPQPPQQHQHQPKSPLLVEGHNPPSTLCTNTLQSPHHQHHHHHHTGSVSATHTPTASTTCCNNKKCCPGGEATTTFTSPSCQLGSTSFGNETSFTVGIASAAIVTAQQALSPVFCTNSANASTTGGFLSFGSAAGGGISVGGGAAAAGRRSATTPTSGYTTTAILESTTAPSNLTSCSGPTTTVSTPTTHKKKSSFMQRKKPLLTRSEVSSSEYFSVSFCTENGCQEEEFIPATKGVNLADALSSALRRRNLSFSQITITDNNLPTFLESGSPPFAGSFDENTEVENLAGRHLIITERDGNKKTLQKAASFGSRTRPPRLLSSASTEESTELAEQRNIPGKQLKQRWSGLFGIKNPQQSQLCDLLNSYTKNGVPQRSSSLNFDHPNFDAALEYLDNMHKSWKDFVHCDDMTDNETKIQTAIWELVTTEVYYIHALQTVTDLFLACLEAIQDEKLLTDVDQHRLFSNVRDICEANLKFWTLYLYPMVSNSVATHAPLCIDFFRPGFVTFATTFAPYKKYCAEQSTCQFYCKELNRNNALFTSYLAWCESQKMCNRLRLADILVRPMQRLTKYSLLLAAIRKHIGDLEDVETIDSMIHTVENFVCSVNNHLTTRQENERLKGVMARIESYDVVDTNNEQLDKIIKQYSQMFDLCAPMKGCPTHQVRHLFMEGDHKFKDNLGKADVHCFLLTDMMLVCKSIAKKGLGALKVIRQPYLTDRLVVQHSNNTLNCVYLNEFQVAITAFTLQCSEAKNWYDSLKRAKLIYTRLKQGSNNWESFRYGANTATCGGGGGNADSLGVKKSPMNSSICSHVTSANNSHSGSVEWNDSRNISVDFEKTNSLSSDEGSGVMTTTQGYPTKPKTLATSPHKNHKIIPSSNTLSVEPINHLGQSLPNLNLHHNQTNNTLLVPGTASSSNSGNLLLSPSHRGKSYPPPSPTRATLRRGMAFSASIKNPPLVKTRNITSQNSINWHQIPATPTPTSPHSPTQHQQSPASSSSSCQQIQKQSPSSPTTKAVTPSMPTNSNNSTTTTTTVPTSRSSGNSKNCLNVSNETDV